jgi:shikimate kinase
MFPKRIFLTGFMGSGKSTAGRKLAALLDRPFIDLDAHVEQAQQRTINEIFREKGESGFRKIEHTSLQHILEGQNTFVLALGGGTLGFKNTLDLVKASGFLVYIELPESAIKNRLQAGAPVRPLIAGLTDEALKEFIREKMQARILHYRQAHITVNGLNLTAQDLQRRIFEATSQNNP